jgi:hypothetical protein
MKILAALLAVVPLAAFAQGAEPQPAPAAEYAPPPTYAPPPQYAPPAQPPPAYARPQKQRDSWYIGFGLGGGSGSLERDGSRVSFDEYLFDLDPTTLTLNLKVGATLTPKLLLGLDLNAVRSAVESGGDDAALQISNYDLVATFFPVGRGLFVRAGAGLSRFTYEENTSYGDYSIDTSGFNVIGGVGYALWLGQQFNLTLNLDFSSSSFGSQDDVYAILPESSRYASFWVGFDWY